MSNHHHAQQQQQQQHQNPQQAFLQNFWSRQLAHAEQSTPDFKQHQLPLARIKKVMKSDQDVKMISSEAPILFSKACEIFIAEITCRAWIHAEENKRRTLQRSDVAHAVSKSDQFDFLIDIVPREEVPRVNRRSKDDPTAAAAAAAVASGGQGMGAMNIGAMGMMGIPGGVAPGHISELYDQNAFAYYGQPHQYQAGGAGGAGGNGVAPPQGGGAGVDPAAAVYGYQQFPNDATAQFQNNYLFGQYHHMQHPQQGGQPQGQQQGPPPPQQQQQQQQQHAGIPQRHE